MGGETKLPGFFGPPPSPPSGTIQDTVRALIIVNDPAPEGLCCADSRRVGSRPNPPSSYRTNTPRTTSGGILHRYTTRGAPRLGTGRAQPISRTRLRQPPHSRQIRTSSSLGSMRLATMRCSRTSCGSVSSPSNTDFWTGSSRRRSPRCSLLRRPSSGMSYDTITQVAIRSTGSAGRSRPVPRRRGRGELPARRSPAASAGGRPHRRRTGARRGG